jgi:hypothetical protein
LARIENIKGLGFGKYLSPSAYVDLALNSLEEKRYDETKHYLAKTNDYKDYELENRLQTVIRSLDRRYKYITNPIHRAALLKAEQEQKREAKLKLEKEKDNFYVT